MLWYVFNYCYVFTIQFFLNDSFDNILIDALAEALSAETV